MSYILNALRKSERERQAIEPETVTARIVAYQTPRQQNSTRVIAALIVINLAVLVYFLGFNDKTPADKTPSAAAPSIADVIKSEEAVRAEVRHPPARAAEAKPPVIAKIVAARSEAAITPLRDKPIVVNKQPIEPAKPALSPQQPAVQAVEPATEVQQTEQTTVPAPVIETAPEAKAGQAKSDLPFLEELPSEFARSLPNLPINVFSYSSTPAERFVMIDMVKYTPGQRIKDQLELKEIRPDGIVVNYDGRTFKIRRP